MGRLLIYIIKIAADNWRIAMEVLVKDDADQVIKISTKKLGFLLDIFQAAADDSQYAIKDVITLITENGIFAGERKYIPVALGFDATANRLGDASAAHKDADLTDVTGNAVNTRIKQQLNIT
jgi:hypothetical protein